MMQPLSDDDIAAIRAPLLAWFDVSARTLPWRSTSDPYAIWVSEVMTQQTRVETVVPYYDRWIGAFPDVHSLADASLDDVLKAWEGLGYYSRARNLHAAARVVRERHQGALPRSYTDLRALPGIGEYTAGAIASIAFGGRHPAVDGNVRRVLARVLDLADAPTALVRAVASALVPPGRAGDFNQALMELGAMVCTPQAPRCPRCPIAAVCAARAAGTQLLRPRVRRRKAIPTVDVATAVLRDPAGRLLLVRRPPNGLLGGMWSFPGVEFGTDEDAGTCAANLACTHARIVVALHGIGVVEHVFSHRRERYHCFLIDVAAPAHDASGRDAVWIAEGDEHGALPRAQQRIRRMAFAADLSADPVSVCS